MPVAAVNVGGACEPGDARPGAGLAPPDANSTIPARMRYLAACLPDQIAVIDDEQSLTYAELEAAADRLANVLLARLGVAPEPVALLLPNRVAIAIGILGVIKAGKFYAPLDPNVEPAVRRVILGESGARVLLTVKQLLPSALAHAASGLAVIDIDTLDATTSMREQAPQLHPRSYALVTFTSGTTGVAKGVLADHGNILFRARQAYRYDRITPADRVGQLVAPTFALFASVFFATLLNGATLIFYDRSAAGMAGLLAWVADIKLSVFYAPVSLLRDLLAAPGPLPRIPSVRTVLLGGQSFVLRDLLGLRSVVEPGCTVVNRLSMSEVLLVARHEIAPAEFCDCADLIPVGEVCEGHEVLLLDDEGVSVAPGGMGQIVVRSEQLSPGYLRNPELTDAKFRPDPGGSGARLFYTGDLGRYRPDGRLEHCGRLDFMVKIRGFRVEPEAIAAAIKAHPAVVECVVVADAATEHDPRLVAYYAVKNLPGPTTQELRTLLAQTLPSYMIPARFMRMAHLPRNTNGKIDRAALPAPDRIRPELETPYVAPRTGMEARIAELWAETLELDLVGIDDNFFALGGDSLSALRMVLQVEAFAGRRAPPSFFDRPTVAYLAQLVSPLDDADAAMQPSREVAQAAAIKRPDRRADMLAPQMSAVRRHAKQVLTGEVRGQQVLRGMAQQVALQLSYFGALRWLGWWSRQPAVANWLYAEERDLFYRFVGDVGAPVQSREQLFRANLFANCIGQCMNTVIVRQEGTFPDRLTAWSHSRYRFARTLAGAAQLRVDGDPGGLIAFAGFEHLAETHAAGNGVILLTYHGAVSFLASPLLGLYGGLGSIQVVSAQRAWKAAVRQSSADKGALAERWQAVKASELLAARRQLSERGAIQFVIDGLSSTHDGADRTIFGHEHRIVAGLSGLAKATGSSVLPFMDTVEPSGRVSMRFYPQFRSPSPAASEDEWLASMADQCAFFLQASWRQAPESLSWGAIRRHYLLPTVD